MIYKLSEKYFVRTFGEEDIDGPYLDWFEDQEVCRYNGHGKIFYSKLNLKEFASNANNERQIVWAIIHVEDGHIGNISLQNINFINRTAEFAIIMGNKDHWGRGVATSAAKKLIAHGFEKVNLEKIYCGTAETNFGMQKLANSIGMAPEGRRREHVFLEGKRVDVLEFGLLRSEFNSHI